MGNSQQDHTIESFGRSFEYTMTLITTIGYGHITPTGQAAKLATVFYGAVGIPLFLATMFKIGSILASIVVGLFTLCGQKSKNEKYMPIDGDKSSIVSTSRYTFNATVAICFFQLVTQQSAWVTGIMLTLNTLIICIFCSLEIYLGWWPVYCCLSSIWSQQPFWSDINLVIGMGNWTPHSLMLSTSTLSHYQLQVRLKCTFWSEY